MDSKINPIPSSVEGFTTTLQVPKCPPKASNGLFPSDLMGSDIIPFLKSFNPEQYASLPLDACDDSIFSICLQGANIANAVWIWLSLLKWPPDVDVENSNDWGISWFELTVSFYLCTGFRFPLRVGGAGNKSVYVEYGSDEALILPGHQRSAVLQGICLRNMIQNLLTISGQKIFPSFKTFKCRSLTRLGLKGVVAVVGRRPVLPNSEPTMDFVAKYMANLQGNALNEPIFLWLATHCRISSTGRA